jgi:outer membrane protein assembly factor BamB
VGATLVTTTLDGHLVGWGAETPTSTGGRCGCASTRTSSVAPVTSWSPVAAAGHGSATPAPARSSRTAPANASWWAAAEDGTLLLADTGPRTEVVALAPDGAERWRTALPGDEPDAACCVEVAPTRDGRVLAVDRRVAGRAAVLDLTTGAVLADVGRAASAVPGLLLIGAHGDLGVLQGEGAVAGVALATGEVRWRTSDASVLVGLDPLVVSGRRHLLGPWAPG